MRFLAPTLALVLVTVLPGTARSAQDETAPAPPDLGGPLVVGGIEIPQDEIKRFLIYGPLRAELEYLRIQAWIEHEIERRVRESEAAGEERGERPRSWRRVDFEPDARRVQAHVDSAVSAIEREFPTLDLDTEMRREHRHVDWFERKLRQEVAFDEVFLADDPDRWPSITFEILREEAGEILVDDFRQSYERRVTELEESLAEWREKVAAGGSDAGAEPTLRPEDTFYREILRDIIVDGLAHLAEIETSETGLPPGLVYRLDVDKDGEPELVLKTDDLWDRVKARAAPEEIAEARRFLTVVEATRQRLAKEGWLMSPSAATTQRKRRLEAQDHHFISIAHLPPWYPNPDYRYPSREASALYAQLIESYRDSVSGVIADHQNDPLPPELQEQFELTSQARGLAKVNVEVLLCSAFSFLLFRWKENGWERAEWMASRLMWVLEDDPEKWDELRKELSEFWDPPLHGSHRESDYSRFHGGEFGKRSWTELRHLMGESDYSLFVNGKLLTDEIFFHSPVGTITGPHRCHWGYCLVLVKERTSPLRPLDLAKEGHRRLLLEDWIRASFIEYSHEALAAVK